MSPFNADNTPLKFPCRIGVKALGAANAGLPQRVERIAALHAKVVDLQTSGSRQGRYISVTVTVEAEDRDQLAALYSALHDDDAVLMTL
ncbi:DUF493 domain-containing protein [Halorhodospira abdelmalekii]|uniref:YbeD family protein n=1 Tax=Halorhodospira abdelmalekii TaxID=421629 RepID=UPI001905F099|nr:DUF493 domain-containing protein [Halorhodospira abdelmalekii]MBK1734018.1 DUF493 domain-containing protein [Halorhodospira abdelmalekii]